MPKYLGPRCIPTADGKWDKTKEYLGLSVVLDEKTGDSYTSKKVVPAGTELTNKDYWALSGQYNAQMALIKLQLEAMQNIPEGGTTADAALENIRIGADGTEYATPGDAVRGQVAALSEEIFDLNISKRPTSYRQEKLSNKWLSGDKKRLYIPVFLKPNTIYRVGSLQGMNPSTVKILDGDSEIYTIRDAQTFVYDGHIYTTNDIEQKWYTLSVYYEWGGTSFWNTNTDFLVREVSSVSGVFLTKEMYTEEYSECTTYDGKALGQDVPSDFDFNKPYKGKVLETYGDSITAQQLWQDNVKKYCGFARYNNHGHGGYRLSRLACSDMIATLPNDFDIMLVMGGMNDWVQDRTIGTITDLNEDTAEGSYVGTFYGGLNLMVKNLLTKFPTKRIVFMTPTPGKLTDGTFFVNKKGNDNGLVNSNGDTLRYFADAIINIAKKYSIPCIDLNAMVGWNEFNISTYVQRETSGYIHPNANGGKRMSEIINGYLPLLKSN